MTVRNPLAGVTLLETLIALLVMGMVAILLSSALGTSARFTVRSQTASDLIDQALSRRDFRHWLEHAVPGPPPQEARPIFRGSATGLEFLSVPSGGVFWSGATTLVVLSDAQPVVTATGQEKAASPARSIILHLAPEGTTFRVAYWGRMTPDTAPEWQEEWPSDAGLPALVRISFSGGPMSPPPMIVRPGKAWAQSEMSLSSLLPPALPSRP